MTFQERLELFPPVLCRLLARERNVPLTNFQIADRSILPDLKAINRGDPRATCLSPFIADQISKATKWDGVEIRDALCFMQGCGVDLTDGRAMVRHDDYLKKNPTFNYLRKHKDWNSYYLPLLVTWRKSYPLDPPENLWPPIRKLLVRLTPIMNQAA